jgi:hypothetical protein
MTVAAALVGIIAAGVFAPSPSPDELPPGANLFTFVLAVALLIGFVVYAAVEWLQTRRFDSITRQFDTRTIVLIPFAIAINVVLGQTVASALKVPVYLDSIGTILVGVLAGPFAGAATGLLSDLAWTFLFAGTPFGSPYAWPFAIVAAEIGLLAGLFGYAGVFRNRAHTSTGRFVAGIVIGLAVLIGLVWYGILPHFLKVCAGQLSSGDVIASGCLDPFYPISTIEPIFLVVALGFLALLAVTLIALLIRLVARRDLGVVFVLVAGAACGVVSALIAAPIAAYVFGGVTGSGTDFLVLVFQQAGSGLEEAVLQQSLISDPIDKTITFLVVYALLRGASRRVTARFPQGERALGTVEA